MIDLSADKLRVFGDESFDEKGERVAAVAGLIGTVKEWDALKDEWVSQTGGKEFHANECEVEHSKNPDKEKHKENLLLYEDLTKIIVKSGLRGFGAAFDLVSFRENFPGAKVDNDVGYYKCFTDLVSHCAGVASGEGRQIEEFTMDNREGKEYNAGLVYQFYRQRPEWKANNIFRDKKNSLSIHGRILVFKLLTSLRGRQ